MKSSLGAEDRSFGERLKRVRLERGWTQAELAKNAKVDRSVIANYEQGVSFPPVPVLRRLALALSISVDRMIFEDVSPEEVIDDRNLLEIFARIDKLDHRTRDIVQELIEGLLAKRELAELRRSRPKKVSVTDS